MLIEYEGFNISRVACFTGVGENRRVDKDVMLYLKVVDFGP